MVEEVPGDVADANALDPEALGFMCGLEVHQQLATGKLHSRQPSTLYEDGIEEIEGHWPRAHRRLRAARGEGGRIDIAARFEQRRNQVPLSTINLPMRDSSKWTKLHLLSTMKTR